MFKEIFWGIHTFCMEENFCKRFLSSNFQDESIHGKLSISESNKIVEIVEKASLLNTSGIQI